MTSSPTVSAQRSRGMRDLLPDDMRAFRRLEDAFRASANRWGYEEIRTPTIETYRLFTTAGALTPQMLSGVYSFLDWDGWSGERVVLRPDSTIPVARAVADGALPLPARLFYVQNVFRFSPDADREDWQCGIEYLGAPASLGDVEVVALACETFDALGLRPEVRFSHTGVARAAVDLLVAQGMGEARSLADGLSEGGLAAVRPLLEPLPQVAAFVDVALRAGGLPLLVNLRAMAQAALPAAADAIDELAGVAAALIESGRPVVVDFGMPLDFEYYNGVFFEFVADSQRWGGGGRYTPTGSGLPGTACGLGLDASQLASALTATTRRGLVVSVVASAASDLGRAIAVARALHRGGIAAALSDNSPREGLSVRVSAGRLVARTPDGSSELTALDDLVGLLVRYK